MNPYSEISKVRLNTCHQDLVLIFTTLCLYENHSIFCGHRGEQEQNQAVEDGNSELHWPDSNHNQFPSMAVDAGPYFIELKNTDWKDREAFALFAGKAIIIAKMLYMQGKISHQLIWGGDWDGDNRTRDEKFRDSPHFELTKENVWNL